LKLKKKSEDIKKVIEEVKDENYFKAHKLDGISQIEDLKIMEQNYKMNGQLDKAIECVDKIMIIAINYDLLYYIKEQEAFIKSIAKEVEEVFFTSKIKDLASWINKQYDDLIKAGDIVQAHDIVENFKHAYNELPYFNSIMEVHDLVNKDNKEWIKHNSQS